MTLFISRFCVAVVGIILLALALRPTAYVFDTPVTEDAYYALTVARNIAAGNGLVIEPGVLTNGVQPLFTLVEAGAFVLGGGDPVVAVRLVMALSWIVHLSGALLLARFAADAWPGDAGGAERRHRAIWAALLFLTAPLILNHAYNGLETGTSLLLYVAVARWFQLDKAATIRGALIGGGLAGLLVLARIDAAVVVAVITAGIVVRDSRFEFARAVLRGGAFGSAAFLVSSPWWLFNIINFGSPIPTSGLAQQGLAISSTRIEFMLSALGKVLMPWIFLGVGEQEHALHVAVPWLQTVVGLTVIGTLRWVALGAAIIKVLPFLRHLRPARIRTAVDDDGSGGTTRLRHTLWIGGTMLVGWVVLVVYYTINFTAYWFYYRYFAPFVLVSVLLAAIWLGRLSARGDRLVPITGALALTAQVGILIVFAVHGQGQFGQESYRAQVSLVEELVPAREAVAAGQSGTLGFFRPRVVNLDGKVNRDVLGRQGRIDAYLRERGVRWFCDWPHYVNKYLGVAIDPSTGRPQREGNGWRLVGERNYFFLYVDATTTPAPNTEPASEDAIALNLRNGGFRGRSGPPRSGEAAR